MISLRSIFKSYGSLPVLKGISLDIQEKEIICITGESGAGKSTLLHILGTLDKPDSGEVIYSNRNVFNFGAKELSSFRNKEIGFVFQFHQLIPELTALENIMLPMMIAGASKKVCETRAMELLQYLGLESRKSHKSTELSGGEQQRIAIGRALSANPKVILADEPSGNLDSKNARSVHDMFLKLREDFGYTFVIVTHNLELPQIADRQIILSDGQILDEIKKS